MDRWPLQPVCARTADDCPLGRLIHALRFLLPIADLYCATNLASNAQHFHLSFPHSAKDQAPGHATPPYLVPGPPW